MVYYPTTGLLFGSSSLLLCFAEFLSCVYKCLYSLQLSSSMSLVSLFWFSWLMDFGLCFVELLVFVLKPHFVLLWSVTILYFLQGLGIMHSCPFFLNESLLIKKKYIRNIYSMDFEKIKGIFIDLWCKKSMCKEVLVILCIFLIEMNKLI